MENKVPIAKDAMLILMGRNPKRIKDAPQIVPTEEVKQPNKSNVNLSQLLNGYNKSQDHEPLDILELEQRVPLTLKYEKRKSSMAGLLSNDGKFNSNPAQPKLIVKLQVPNLKEILEPKTYMVKLKVDKIKLKDIITPKPKIKANESSHPFFRAIKSKMEYGLVNKVKKEEQKERELQLLTEPALNKNQFIYKSTSLIENQALNQLYNNFTHLHLSKKVPKHIDEIYRFDSNEFMEFYGSYLNTNKSMNNQSSSTYSITSFDGDFNALKKERYSNLKDDRFNRLIESSFSDDKSIQWCDLYKPLKSGDVLQTPAITKELHKWIEEAFTKLKKVDKQKRTERLKNKKKKPMSNPLDDFIVFDDIILDDSDSMESNFVPSLIIEGPTGCGKTSAVHAIITEYHGGHVFELNSTQSRAKKDIDFHLKQIGTTSMVNTIENSVILFDDVELIDENDTDKDFWQGVLELLTYSYRPIIFTTNDISKIPRNIVNESTIYKFFNQPSRIQMQYLDLLAMTQNMELDTDILKSLSKLDLRRSIMQLQMISNQYDGNDPVKVSYSMPQQSPIKPLLNSKLTPLESHLRKLDLIYFKDPESALINPKRYQMDLQSCVEFYSSKLMNNRSRIRFEGGGFEDYMSKNTNSLFMRSSRYQLSMDILPLIKSMAKVESMKLENRRNFDKLYLNDKAAYLRSSSPIIPERKFALDPKDIFDDL